MTAKIISFGIQKGGSSKTTTSGVVSYLLSRDHKVLTIDMDSQGNLTEFLARRDVVDFSGRTIYFERMKTVEQAAIEADPYLASYILKAVTEGHSYNYLQTKLNIPCGRDMYYDRYRRFFWILSNSRN